MWQRFLIWIFKHLSRFCANKLYGPISKLWRKLFEKKYKEMPSDIPWKTNKLLRFYKECKWVSDPLGGVVDIISKPEKFYKRKKGDCDEFAIFACHVLPWPKFFLSVQWFDPSKKWFKKFNGHNVCAYYYNQQWWHIGNWGRIGPFDKFFDLVQSIPPEGAVLCNYSVRNHNSLKTMVAGIFVDK